MEESTRLDSVGQGKDIVVCPSCLTENVPSVDFCKNCGCPLSSIATIDPLRRAYSMGWAYRKAAGGPIGLIVLVGMWLLLLPTAILSPFAFLQPLRDDVSLPARAVYAILWGIPGLASGYLLYRMTRNYFRRRRPPRDDESHE